MDASQQGKSFDQSDHKDGAVVSNSAESGLDFDPTAYELLCRWAGDAGARRLRQYLSDNAQFDENSYLCLSNLMDLVTMRAAASVPWEMAAADAQLRSTISSGIEDIKRTLEAYSRTSSGGIDIEPTSHRDNPVLSANTIDQVGKLAEASARGWRRLFRSFKLLCIHHVGLILAGGSILLLIGWIYPQWKENLHEQQLQKQIIKLNELRHELLEEQSAWYAEQSAGFAKMRETSFSDMQQRAVEQVKQRFQQLTPTTYQLAQHIEKTMRKVSLPGRMDAWEITLTEAQGLIDEHNEYDGSVNKLKLYFRIEPNRLPLSATASSTQSGTLGNNTKAKFR